MCVVVCRKEKWKLVEFGLMKLNILQKMFKLGNIIDSELRLKTLSDFDMLSI